MPCARLARSVHLLCVSSTAPAQGPLVEHGKRTLKDSTLLTHLHSERPNISNSPAAPQCPVCERRHSSEIVALRDVPVNIGRLWPTREEALDAPRGDVVLSCCHACGFVFNSAYDPEAIAFEPGYEYSLHHSPAHLAFLKQTVDRLISDYDLHDKDIVEVGCGGGFFLQLLCERGGSRGWGFDPAIAEETTIPCGAHDVTLFPGFYDETRADVPCDLLVSRSMFELIHNPIAFLRSMRRALGQSSRRRFYLDIPNSSYVFSRHAMWNLFYEQCNYFVESTLVAAFRRAGFNVLRSGECLGDGYYLFVEAAPGAMGVEDDCDAFIDTPTDLLDMAAQLESRFAWWNRKFASWRADGKRVVAWGSGGRAINFLNLIDGAQSIEHIVDINPARHGGFVSGSGQQIIGPDELPPLRPDVIVITNSLYGQEIRGNVAALGLSCEFVEI
jgi:SAM-dependent methyltransferase